MIRRFLGALWAALWDAPVWVLAAIIVGIIGVSLLTTGGAS